MMLHESGKVGVIGAGRWAGALAELAHRAGHEVTLYCLPEDCERLKKCRRIPRTQFYLSRGIGATDSSDSMRDCEVVFVAVDGKNLRKCLAQWTPHVTGAMVVAVKTLLVEDGKIVLPLDLVEYPKAIYFASAAFPKGVLRDSPTIGATYAKPKDIGRIVPWAISKKPIRVYTSDDPIGGQVGSALKNVSAVAAGMAKQLGFDVMTQNSIAARGMAEAHRLAIYLGSSGAAFTTGTSLHTDFFGTCSMVSHNYQAGVSIAGGLDLNQVEKIIGTAEGIHTAEALSKLALPVELPISQAVVNVIRGANPEEEVEKLLERPLK